MRTRKAPQTPLVVEMLPVEQLKPHPHNARTHSKKQIAQIASSIKAVGFRVPVLVNDQHELLAGHGRLAAAKLLGMGTIPALTVSGLSTTRQRSLLLADNRIAMNAGYDLDQLAAEFATLPALLEAEGLDFSWVGFPQAEIDRVLADFNLDGDPGPADDLVEPRGPAVSKIGDLWRLGSHQLACGDARNLRDLNRLMNGELARMAFLDPPYNVAIRGVVGRGRIKHREFAMASGELSSEAFSEFWETTLKAAAAVSAEGAVHYVCMDWRHIAELMMAGRKVYGDTLNVVTWDKSNAGQGSFYRSQSEFIGVFRVGSSGHLNNIELGKHGRSRSNVWRYAGVNSFRRGRLEDLKAHPTVKPVDLIADAIKDCTRRRDLVLDTFSGSGTTLLACERTGRIGRAIEIDPVYVDVAVRRWQQMSGRDALLDSSGRTFDEIEATVNSGAAK